MFCNSKIKCHIKEGNGHIRERKKEIRLVSCHQKLKKKRDEI